MAKQKKLKHVLPYYALCKCERCLIEMQSMVAKGELVFTYGSTPDRATINKWVEELYL